MKLRSRNGQRGIALVTVMIAIAITLVISNEFGTTTSTDMIAAANYRDQVRSHFLALSAKNFGELVIRVQQRLDSLSQGKNSPLAGMGPIQITDYADQLLSPFCGSPEEVQSAIGFSSTQVKGLGADIGTCGFNGPFKTEDDKLNLNCANTTDENQYKTLLAAVGMLIFPTAYDSVFDDNDAEGWKRDRTQQAAALLDYVDKDTMRAHDRGTTEDYGYESLRDRYYAKNNYLDTIGELKLARGVDDRFWTLFGDAFTVYGSSCRINLATLTNVQLIAAILSLSAAKGETLQNDQRRLFLLAGYVAKAREFGETFSGKSGIDDFIAFVKDPSAAVMGIAGSGAGSLQGSAAASALQAGLPGLQPGEKIGMALDKQLLTTIVVTSARRTYRVEAWGEIERKFKNSDGSPVYPAIRSTITGVWDTKVFPQNARKPPVPNGGWVYLKED